ncbi:MAG: hypothetical protein ACJA0Q_000488 [Saprospiraceae bacterium]|jgi:hypothetical protein
MMDPNYKLKDIPKDFYQDSEGKVFCDCTFCGNDLGEDEPYMIEKAFKVNPSTGMKVTLYEYAICGVCSMKKMDAMSMESVQNIQAYMQEHVYDEWGKDGVPEDYKDKLRTCPATGNDIVDLQEYNYVGQFVGGQMVVGVFPMAIDASLGESMQDLLSESTKKEFDDFMDTITGIPPELRELFKSKRPVMV